MKTPQGFPRYLLSKQSVDDRALNKDVVSALSANLPAGPISIVEAGGGIGTMLIRMLRWNLITEASYVLVDAMEENIQFGLAFLPDWATGNGYSAEQIDPYTWKIQGHGRSVTARFVQADIFDYLSQRPTPADLLVAHAFLDLIPLPSKLHDLLSFSKDLAWLTINFDGASVLEPAIDDALDRKIEQLYHSTMDARSGGGDSQTGRKLFSYLAEANMEILAAGASDWVVYPQAGNYPADEAFFLQFILGFYRKSLSGLPDLDTSAFSHWLDKRQGQINRGELIYIAHQIDYLVKRN
jgi:hypothetical protein